MSLPSIGSLFSIYTAPPHNANDRELMEKLNLLLSTLEGMKTQMASIHTDVTALKAEVASLLITVATALANVTDDLATKQEESDIEDSIAKLKQVENTITGALAVMNTPPPIDAPPVTTPPVTTPPIDAPPVTPSDPGAPSPAPGEPPPLVDPAVAAALRSRG